MRTENRGLAVINNDLKQRGDGSMALMIFEGPVTKDRLVARGHGLGMLMGLIKEAALTSFLSLQLKTEADLDGGKNYDVTSEFGMQRIFCGVQETADSGKVAVAYVRQSLLVQGGGKLHFTVGVESIPVVPGLSKYWFELEAEPLGNTGVHRLVKVETEVSGKIMFTDKDGPPFDVTRLGERSKAAILQKMDRGGVPYQALILAQDIRWVGSLMSGFAGRSLGNAWREWPEKNIWQCLFSVDLNKWKFCMPKEKIRQ